MIEFTEFTEKLNSSELVSKAWDEIDRDQANAGLLIDTISNEFKDWQPPKPLVVVPQFVARYIETEEGNVFDRVGALVYGHYKAVDGDKEYYEFNEWISYNFDTFLEAIVNGYTVEKEQLYEIRIPLPKGNYASIDSKGYIWGDLIPNKYKLTESEVKNIDERYWAFAVPVEEVEP